MTNWDIFITVVCAAVLMAIGVAFAVALLKINKDLNDDEN